jgi:hypothetical protein
MKPRTCIAYDESEQAFKCHEPIKTMGVRTAKRKDEQEDREEDENQYLWHYAALLDEWCSADLDLFYRKNEYTRITAVNSLMRLMVRSKSIWASFSDLGNPHTIHRTKENLC